MIIVVDKDGIGRLNDKVAEKYEVKTIRFLRDNYYDSAGEIVRAYRLYIGLEVFSYFNESKRDFSSEFQDVLAGE